MPSQTDYLKFAETAFASYAANLILGRGSNEAAYKLLADMAPSQAQRFDATWQVLGQQDLSDGFSATLFQEVDLLGHAVGQKTLAIRGSESSHWGIDYLADAINIAILGTAAGSSQYESLERFYQSLIRERKLDSRESIVVTGHSLGGFLTQAFASRHEVVSAGYTFNSPGFSVAPGAVTNIGTQILKIFGLSGVVPNEKIFNIRALEGLSVTSGLGQMIGTIVPLNIELGSAVHNHSIVTLTDSLSVYAIYSRLSPDMVPEDIGTILKAASNEARTSLESSLDDLRRIVLGRDLVRSVPTALEDRDSFYVNLHGLVDSNAFKAVESGVQIGLLAGKSASSLAALAEEGVGYRYALTQLDSFAILGDHSLFDRFDASGELQLYDFNSGRGLTNEYLADRAAMLVWKIRDYVADGSFALRGDAIETYKYVDRTKKNSSGSDLNFTISGRQPGSIGNPAFVIFGSDAAENLVGGNLAVGDHLYGGGGNDTLDGKGGDDYLEGGQGDDILTGADGDDELNGGPGFDTYAYSTGDGFDTITDPGGAGRIVFDGRELAGGSKVADGVYKDTNGHEYILIDDGNGGQSLEIDGSLYVEDYTPGALGIHLEGDTPPVEPPESITDHVFFNDGLPTDFDFRNSDIYSLIRRLFGSSGADRFLIAGTFDIVGRSGNDVAILDAGVRYTNAIDLGADDDLIDARASLGAGLNGRLAGGGGNDYILGGEGADSIWGDSYFAISAERFFGRPAYAGAFMVDDLIYASGGEFTFGRYQLLPKGGILRTIGQSITLTHGGLDPEFDSVVRSDGVLFDGTLEQTLAAVIGGSGTFDDYIDAGGGDDTVVGGSGSDEIFGGAGDDMLVGDYGDGGAARSSGAPSYATLERDFGSLAALFGRPGDDHIHGGDGSDVIADIYGGNDVLDGGPGDDFIHSREGLWSPEDGVVAHNVIHGGAGDDEIVVDNDTGGFDVVDGGDGDDNMRVFASRSPGDADGHGRAIVFGGNGDDVLGVDADIGIVNGGAGDDDYTVSGESITIVDAAGDDALHLDLVDMSQVDAWLETFPIDIAQAPGHDDFAEWQNWTVSRDGGDLVFKVQAKAVDDPLYVTELTIKGWHAGAGNRIEHIATGDSGPVLTSAQFEAWGGLHYGSDAADELVEFSEQRDRAIGGGGDDLIATGDGDDLIYGGRGDDELLGGSGNDAYYYALGDGNDTVEDLSGNDEIRFGAGIRVTDVVADLAGSDLVLRVGGETIEVRGGRRASTGIERLRFADGSTASVAALLPPLTEIALDSGGPADPDPPQGNGNGGSHGGSDPGGAVNASPAVVTEVGDGIPGTGQPQSLSAPNPPDEFIDLAGVSGTESPADGIQAIDPADEAFADTDIPVDGVEISPAFHATSSESALLTRLQDSTSGLGIQNASSSTVSSESANEIASLLSSIGRSDPGLIFARSAPDVVPVAFSGGQSDQDPGERGNPNSPLNLQALVDAVQEFDAGLSALAVNAPLPAGAQEAVARPDQSPASGPEVTSWALTNALLQFHLERGDGIADSTGLAGAQSAESISLRTSMALGQQAFGLSSFSQQMPSLSTFSGLQEGFVRL